MLRKATLSNVSAMRGEGCCTAKQVAAVNRVIEEEQTENILEVAPGPARLATELKGVRHGLMIDNSAAMLTVAKHRLEAAGIAHLWKLQKGNAFELEKIGQKFSLVFTFRFIRHFRQDERARLYGSDRSLSRTSRPSAVRCG